MSDDVPLPSRQPMVEAAARLARMDPYESRERLVVAARGGVAEAATMIVAGWVYSPTFEHTLLVRHPRFGWLTPGGRLQPGEDPAHGARREVVEETGVAVRALFPEPIAVLGNRRGSDRMYGLAYAFVADPMERLSPEVGQPAAWYDIEDIPRARYPLDREALQRAAAELCAAGRPEPGEGTRA
ncbi:NUDIX hydrolase [Streptomyces sp. SID3343]|uniref:NUDIX domain-containing protein n=1 Tax=Streptomyces sp. SID3343 TaxID=2690260 RepID=UPI00136B338F|nr:NUDIX hydrolase [Streptomyces sp. SID3343]MYW03401.1 NUDIX domain-containing protein [Streptomyces sp. SID3343]